MSRYLPIVGRWYQECDSDQVFEIVACDQDEGTVQIQYLDGELADYDFESWAQLNLIVAAEPEDWRKVFEMDDDNAWSGECDGLPLQWGNPLTRIEPETVLGVDDL